MNTALSLVGYESEVKAAIAYVFGSTLVCDTIDHAKKVQWAYLHFHFILTKMPIGFDLPIKPNSLLFQQET